ncbi:MAG: heterodisulfide reductase-related iron-sulfur binding cluster [Burkholderiales bacterium]
MSVSTNSLAQIADTCVACGLCVPRCPTYRKTGSEADSPRGRIALIKGVLDENIPANPRFIEHIDLCLTCRACERICPNNVRFGELIDGTRARIEPLRPLFSRLLARSARALIARPRSLQSLAVLGALVRALRIPLPARTRAWLASVSWPHRFEEWYPAQGETRGEVALFIGCVARIFDVATLTSTIFVLNSLGYGVRIPRSQTCCGALARRGGDSDQARKLVERNLAAFEKADFVVTTATGCGLTLAEYGDDYGARTFSAKVVDIGEFIANHWNGPSVTPLPAAIAVHKPCTSRHSTKDMLEKIPAALVKPLPGNDQCCGAAGAYFLTQPAMANALRQEKVDAFNQSGAQILATSNIGCALHFKAAGINAAHPVTLLAKQMGF